MAAGDAGDDRLTPRRLLTLILCAMMMAIEGYDLAAMPIAVPLVSAAWGLPPPAFAVALSGIVFGIGFAAIVLAPFGDRLDRRRMILVTAVIATIATLGTATAGSTTELFVWRLLTGLSLGACLPNITATVARIAPAGIRARTLTLVSTAIPVGSVLAGLIAGPIVALGGWPAMFVAAGALTAIVTALLWAMLSSPEIGERLAVGAPAERPRLSLRPPVLALLERRYLPSTIVFLGLATTNTFLFYMLISWLPTLLPMGGVPVAEAARLSALVQAGGIGGSLVFSWFLDRRLSVFALLGGYGIAILAFLGFAAGQTDVSAIAVMLVAIGAGISGAHTAIMVLGMSFYPPHMLSSAVGGQIAITRAGAVSGPLVGGWLIATAPGLGPFMLAAILPAAICILWVLAVPRVRGSWRA